MFLEYGEESMLTLGARLVSNMNVVRDNQVVGYFLNLENTLCLDVLFGSHVHGRGYLE